MSRLPKASHQLNLMAVHNWAKSLSPEDRAQWLSDLAEQDGERSPGASDASLRHSDEAGELSPSGVSETVAGDVASEGGPTSVGIDGMKKPYRPSRSLLRWENERSKGLTAERERLKLEQDSQAPELEQEVQALVAQSLKPEQDAQALELEQIAQSLAQALEQKGG